MQILILGMHRSGTSLTTRLVNMMGAYFGPSMGADEATIDNPKGFWEHPEVFKLNDAILASRGCGWNQLKNWDFRTIPPLPESLAGHIRRIVGNMNQKRPWVLKDPRHCLLLPAWRPYLDSPVGVIVHRDPLEIALSLQKRDRFPIEYSIALWEYYAVGLLTHTKDMPCAYVQHSHLLRDPVAATASLYKQLLELGVTQLSMPAEQDIHDFTDKSLYRSRADTDNGLTLSAHQQWLSESLQGLRPPPVDLQVSESSQTIMKKGLG